MSGVANLSLRTWTETSSRDNLRLSTPSFRCLSRPASETRVPIGGEDDMDEELQGRGMDNSYSDDEEYGQSECKPTQKGGMYYEFRRDTRSVKSTILHFQLRNLVWATSKHDVHLMSHYSILHWSTLTCKKSEVMNVSGHVAPREKHPRSLLEDFSWTQVSTLAVKAKLLVAGGF